MKKITKKVILNTTKDSLNEIVDQLQIDPNKKTKKVNWKTGGKIFCADEKWNGETNKTEIKICKNFS